ncbi:MOSC domain-containing protein [Paracoccus aminophilus]|uniref:MOSC domain protein n=1 Tax=Paracoccus aminophilus JCM 7686 TaxID=1367847 RepID=S5XRF5_PARAH|nr:MOSC domain-containing protein [Paracoccus aminophilus]AGT09989.1 MOSC domain protein [Paracoccus aminophilus JCM 7686]
MSARLSLIRRHPIKSIGGERLETVALQPSRPLPGDRLWALLHQGGERHAGAVPERWLPKSCFLQGAKCASLQAVQGGWGQPEPGRKITLSHPDRPDLSFDPETEGQRLIDWILPLWPEAFPAPTRLVRAPVAFADASQPYVSILSLSTLAALEAKLGQSFGVERWRGNLWIEGWAPEEERSLIGQVLTIGEVELRVVEPITRCPATSASALSGLIDIDMPATLEHVFGHRDFGVYAQVVTGGTIHCGDEVR